VILRKDDRRKLRYGTHSGSWEGGKVPATYIIKKMVKLLEEDEIPDSESETPPPSKEEN
jgi:hypothetical protein